MKQSRLFGIVLTVALAVLFFTAVTPAVVSAATIYVPEGGNQTIQQAVNNATAGDTVIVRDGTYHENVDVGVAHLTIRSENGSANCIVNASDSNDHVFAVTVSYVNVSGFTVENATDWGMAGIYLGGVEHCNISDNTASHNRRGIYLGVSLHNLLANNTANLNEDYGIYLSSSNYNNLTNNTASHNNHDGIRIESSSNNDIEGGNVSYNDNKGIYIMAGVLSYNNVTAVLVTGNAIGIVLENEDNCVIKNNTLNFNTGNGIYITGGYSNDNKIINNTVNNSYDGIYIESNSNLVEDNNVNNNDNCGIYIGSGNNLVKDNIANDNEHSGIQLLDCSDNEIIGNVANNNDYGISMWMWSNANHNITSNTLSDNDDCGIYMDYCGGCNISNNTVNNNTWGISVVDGWDSEITCNWVHHNNERGINVAGTGYNISLNNIMFNGVLQQGDGSYHWNFYNDQGNAVDAKNNYWVAMDNETIDKSIYDGDPGEGGGKVTFYPFETGPVPCAPIPELATVVLLGVGLVVLVGYVRIRRKDKG